MNHLTEYTGNTKGMQLLVHSECGVYGPRDFADYFGSLFDIVDEDMEILSQGPDHEEYLETWDHVIDNCEHVDDDGNEWKVYENEGDIWAICGDLLSPEEWASIYPDEMWPTPSWATQYEVCPDCLIGVANGEFPDDEGICEASVRKLEAEYDTVSVDGDSLGFSHQPCECCNGLPSERFRLICFNTSDIPQE